VALVLVGLVVAAADRLGLGLALRGTRPTRRFSVAVPIVVSAELAVTALLVRAAAARATAATTAAVRPGAAGIGPLKPALVQAASLAGRPPAAPLWAGLHIDFSVLAVPELAVGAAPDIADLTTRRVVGGIALAVLAVLAGGAAARAWDDVRLAWLAGARAADLIDATLLGEDEARTGVVALLDRLGLARAAADRARLTDLVSRRGRWDRDVATTKGEGRDTDKGEATHPRILSSVAAMG